MSVRPRVAAILGALTLAVALGGCVPSEPVTVPTGEPQGPQPPSDAPITLQQLASVVTEADAPAQSLFDVGAASTSGADLLSERDYWVAVGGRPEECRDVVSSPYLVRSADAEATAGTDDPTGALGTYSEDEDLFGIAQVYGRIFDDEAAAAAFLAGFTQTVSGCAAYQLIGEDGAVNYDAVALHLQESTTAPIGTRQLEYSEDVTGSGIVSVSTTFVQRKNAVVAIYAELYPSSTMTPVDIASLTATVTERLAAL